MKCPSCVSGQLCDTFLETDLRCKTCDHCGGNWIMLSDYLAWKTIAPDYTIPVEQTEIVADETRRALICPVTGNVMLKYRISKELQHRIDLSPVINAFWLDRGEWQLLKQANLADSLNKIATNPWQYQLRKALQYEHQEQHYMNELGVADYQKMKEICEWIYNHPKKERLLVFLDIYKP